MFSSRDGCVTGACESDCRSAFEGFQIRALFPGRTPISCLYCFVFGLFHDEVFQTPGMPLKHHFEAGKYTMGSPTVAACSALLVVAIPLYAIDLKTVGSVCVQVCWARDGNHVAASFSDKTVCVLDLRM